MATLLEMTVDIVASHARTAPMTTDEIIQELKKVYSALQSIESGGPVDVQSVAEEGGAAPSLTIKQAFRTNEVVCMLCGKGGMKTLTRHLNQAHQLSPSQYRKQFNISKSQPLMSKGYAQKRKEIAAGMDLGANLVKAREARQVNIQKGKGKKK
jgi:predicted transcriptional regulator